MYSCGTCNDIPLCFNEIPIWQDEDLILSSVSIQIDFRDFSTRIPSEWNEYVDQYTGQKFTYSHGTFIKQSLESDVNYVR